MHTWYMAFPYSRSINTQILSSQITITDAIYLALIYHDTNSEVIQALLFFFGNSLNNCFFSKYCTRAYSSATKFKRTQM